MRLSRRGWLIRLTLASLRERRGRAAVAFGAVLMMAAVLVTAATLSFGMRRELGHELAAYGANVMVTPTGTYLGPDTPQAVEAIDGVATQTGQLYASIAIDKAAAEAIGMDLAVARERGWRVTGEWPKAGELLLGANLSDGLAKQGGATVSVRFGTHRVDLRVAGVVETGGPEDGSVLMDLAALQGLSGRPGALSAIMVRAAPDQVDAVVAAVAQSVPGAAATTLRQVTSAEQRFLEKMELLMALAALVVLLGSGIAVGSTMSALVHERLGEVGLMRALGGTRRELIRMHLGENITLGALGGVGGAVVGFAAAEAVALTAFGRGLPPDLPVLLSAPLFGALVAVVFGLPPLVRALRRKPALLLREA